MRLPMPVFAACALIALAPARAAAQTGSPPPVPANSAASPQYNKPLRGFPARRVTGASRGARTIVAASIELLAPDEHTGETASASPSLYYFASAPVTAPVRLTIAAPMQVAPVLEADIPAPRAAGIYRMNLADFGVRLEPGIVYVWSVSATVNPEEPSNDLVASAAVMRTSADPGTDSAVRAASPVRRAALLARAGLWYDAIAAAREAQDADHHAALDALIDQVGLAGPSAYEQRTAAGIR